MFIRKIKHTIERFGLIERGDTVVVGVSGGPDSVALLYVLHALSAESGIRLHIAHLDHMLRRDSAGDARFVGRLAEKLRVPASFAKADIRALVKKGSLEEGARNARLQFFSGIAKKVRARKIALGHTLDDQAETVLMRILRGTGLYGLSGILPKRTIGRFIVVRPLIEARRREVEAFLRQRKIVPRIDASNFDEAYFRNRIRNKLMPLLEKEFNKNIKEVLSNMAESTGYDYEYLNRQAARMQARSGTRLQIHKLLRMHPAMRRLVLRLGIARVQGDTRRIAFAHVREIEDLLLSRPLNSVVDLPKGISCVRKKTRLLFYKR